MAALGTKMRTLEGDRLAFRCPGCKQSHQIDTKLWSFDGNIENPTFSPSVLVTGVRSDLSDEDFARAVALPKDVDRTTHPEFGLRCHSFVRGGMIEYLMDCHHSLKGTTVPMPPWGVTE